MKKKTKPAVKPALPETDFSGITLDLAQRIYEKAVERATLRKEALLERILETLRLEYINLDAAAGKEILTALLADGVTDTLIRAEVAKMNATIAFLAQDTKNPIGNY